MKSEITRKTKLLIGHIVLGCVCFYIAYTACSPSSYQQQEPYNPWETPPQPYVSSQPVLVDGPSPGTKIIQGTSPYVPGTRMIDPSKVYIQKKSVYGTSEWQPIGNN